MSNNKGFASDNHSGVHPDILRAIISANVGHANAYGNDDYTKRAVKKFKEYFGSNIEVYFVYNGTAANILGLKTIIDSFNSIICAETAHLNVHECCGPENFIGCKLITVPTVDGKLTINQIKPHIFGFDDPHRAQPKVISITQPTELGTVYTPEEIRKLSNFAHRNRMLIHIDGARLCNAAAYLNVEMKDITGNVGVDILSFGGTKNGMMFGEAVIFFNKQLSKNFVFISLWLKNAKHSNRMAQLLYKEIKDVSQIKITQKVETNAVFAIIPKKYIPPLQKKYFFHVNNEQISEVRWMCSFDTTKEDIMNFSEIIKRTIV
jgi:threonine aldolase